MIKGKLLFFIMFFAISCTGYAQQNEAGEDFFPLQSEALINAVAETPFAALIRITSFQFAEISSEKKSDDNEQKVICYADVIKTFRGEVKKNISFTIYVEQGEELGFPEKPFIITLCKSNKEYYWPGTGAMFSAEDELIRRAEQAGENADNMQEKFIGCE